MNYWIRRIHRWVSMAFTLVVLANILAFGMGHAIEWLYLLPLLPLALLLATGLYLFALPWLARWRARGAA